MYLIVMTHSEVHIQRVHFEPEIPVLIYLVLPNSRTEHGNLECEKGLFKPRSDCSYRNSLIRVFIDCNTLNFLHT